MRLVTFGARGAEQPGILQRDDRIVPLLPLLRSWGVDAADATGVLGLLPSAHDAIARFVASDAVEPVPAASTRLGPPIRRPGKIIEVGVNTQGMLRAVGARATRFPAIFAKPSSTVSGPRDAIVHPPEVRKLDYEVELAVVIGRQGRRIARDEAWAHVGGFMIANDVTARDIQFGEVEGDPQHRQNFLGKSFDSFCPTGPCLLTPDEVDDPRALRLQLFVNDELRQDGSVAELLWEIPALIEYCSRSMTMEVGDVILTGSPAGIAYGAANGAFLKPGDVVRSVIAPIGELCNPVVDDGAADRSVGRAAPEIGRIAR